MTERLGSPRPSILLIDDTELLLNELATKVVDHLGSDVEVRKWLPTGSEGPPDKVFEAKIDEHTYLVITDYDLTSRGKTGLFGATIVGWCQTRAIPVGDFSRQPASLPKEPNLFELRVPTDTDDAARFVASTFRGFKDIRDAAEAKPRLLTSSRSLAEVLASLLGRPNLENQFALYLARLGSGNSSLINRVISGDQPPDQQGKVLLISYVLGHVLLNAILKFPGPILSEHALCAYVATTEEAFPDFSQLFSSAVYRGPFDGTAAYFWREDVDQILDKLTEPLNGQEFETIGELNRRAVELRLTHDLPRHSCNRCAGKNGGFLCPFTNRPVCQRPDCSVTSSSWIPQGAELCRVEKEFYEEWAPLLGL